MTTTQGTSGHRALMSPLVAAFLGAASAVAVVGLSLSIFSHGATPDLGGPPVPVATRTEATTSSPAPEGCTTAQMIDPGQYESVERTGSTSATWVIIPDSYEQIAPAPLYVLSVAEFTGETSELDLLSPTFEALDGIVVVTAVAGADVEFAVLMDEITNDFCIDPQRIITSIVPALGTSPEREPNPPRPRDTRVDA